METTLRLVEESYDSARCEWIAQIRSCDGDILQTLCIVKPADLDDESEFEWYIEKYAVQDPFSLKRASQVSERIANYAKVTMSPIRLAISSIVGELKSSPCIVRLEIEERHSSSGFHGLHWELLERPSTQHTQLSILVSRYNRPAPSVSVSRTNLFPDKLQILFLTARPSYHADVQYRLLSKPLLALHEGSTAGSKLDIHLVRPGTWEAFKRALGRKDATYSIVHLDMHGEVRDGRAGLIFAPPVYGGRPDFRDASEVGLLLKAAGVTTAVLNACRSARPGLTEEANLAHIFTSLGISNVVAMSFSVMAHTASEFVQSFYNYLLLDRKDLSEAVSYSRLRLREKPERKARFGLIRIVEDAFVPVLYKNYSGDLRWLPTLDESEPLNSSSPQPEFTGRDPDILFLEECLATGNVVHVSGPGGSGKTSLANHLCWWWQYSEFAEKIIHVNCRSIADGSIFRNILQNSTEINTDALQDDDCREILQNQHWIIFLDDCQLWEDAMGSSYHGILPTKPQSQRLIAFVDAFQSQKVNCKVITLSRTSNMLAQCPAHESTWAYTMLPMESAELARIFITRSETAVVEDELVEISKVLELYDSNPLFAEMFLASSPDNLSNLRSLKQLFKMELLESVKARIQRLHSEGKQGLVCDFFTLCQVLKHSHVTEYQILLSLAPFQKRMSASMRPYLINSVGQSIIDCTDNDVHRFLLSKPEGFKIATNPEASAVFFKTHDFNSRYKSLVKILLACGLIEPTFNTSQGVSFFVFHPLLPFLIRYELLSQSEHDQTLSKRLQQNFLEYFEFRTKDFNRLNRDQVRWLCHQEWPNITNAIHICLDHPAFGSRRWNIVESLAYITLLTPTNTTINDGLAVSESVLKEYERWEKFSSPRALPKAVLVQALKTANLQCVLASMKTASTQHLFAATRGLSFLRNHNFVYGVPDPVSLCLKYYFECVLSLETKMSHEQRVESFQRLISSRIPENTPTDFQLFFYKKKADFLITMLGLFPRTHLVLKELNISADSIEREIEGLFTTIAAIPDSKYTSWKTSTKKLKDLAIVLGKHSRDQTDFSHIAQCMPIIRSLARSVPALDTLVDSIAFQTQGTNGNDSHVGDPLEILQNALTDARAVRDIDAQVLIHKSLFAIAQGTEDYEAALEHQLRIIQLVSNREGAEGSQSMNDPRDTSQTAARYNELAAMTIQFFRQMPEQAPEDRVTAAQQHILDAVELSRQAEDTEIECMSLHLMAQWHNVFDKRVPASMACTTAAAMLGKTANEFCQCYFGEGKFLLYLLRVWDSTTEKDELLSQVASVIGWETDRLRNTLNSCKEDLAITSQESNGPGEDLVKTQNEMLRTVL